MIFLAYNIRILSFVIFIAVIMTIIPIKDFNDNEILAEVNGGQLKNQLNHFISNEPQLKGSLIGLSIRSADSGKVIFEHNGDTRLRPASNLKLYTAATALEVLGKEYCFNTVVYSDGPIKENSLKGNLYIKGSGNPTLLKQDLDELALKLKHRGIKTIEGHLIGDDSHFDSVRYSKDLPWSDEQTYYGAQVSALTVAPDDDYDAGTIIIELSPSSKIGQKGRVQVKPKTDYVSIINNTKTVEESGKKQIEIVRQHGSNVIEISGTIPVKSKETKEWIAVWEPSEYTLNLFKQSLTRHGINIMGQTKIGKIPKNSTEIASHQSITLSELLVPFMKLSNNGHAEALVKELGYVRTKEGSWDKGIEVILTELSKLGINTELFVLRDGSGISHVNLVTPNETTKLLYTIQTKKWFPTFLESLPVAGFSDRMIGGTLRHRFHDPMLMGKIRAKTGSLSTVSSLSGYTETESGELLIFSIMLNNLVDESIGKGLEDKIVTILYEYYNK